MKTGLRVDRGEFALYATSRMDEELGGIRNTKNENIARYIGLCDEGEGYCATYTSRKYEFRAVITPGITFAWF